MAARRTAGPKLVDVKADVEAGRGDHAGLHNEEREATAALNAAEADLAREVAALKSAQSKSD